MSPDDEIALFERSLSYNRQKLLSIKDANELAVVGFLVGFIAERIAILKMRTAGCSLEKSRGRSAEAGDEEAVGHGGLSIRHWA